MRLPNPAIKHEKRIMLTVQPSQQIKILFETSTTHVELLCYNHLIFGLDNVAKKFQSIIRASQEGIEGVGNLSDNIIVHAKTQEEHDYRLKATLQRLRKRNITLSKSKCEFNRDELEISGNVFSNKDMLADLKKIAAIKEAKPPANMSELRHFLSVTNNVSWTVPHRRIFVSR
jgi:hypothetical protein